MKRLAMLISGGGTTMEAIIKECKYTGRLDGLIEPALVVASNGAIGGICKAIMAGMPLNKIVICDRSTFRTNKRFGEELLEHFSSHHIDIVGQYGWKAHTPTNVTDAYIGRIFNQHNNPLDPGRPHFGGKGWYGMRNVCARLLYAKQTEDPEEMFTEATCHRVIEEMDQGEVIAREEVEIRPEDTPYDLRDRLLPVEHQLQITVLDKIARNNTFPLIRTKPLVREDRIPLVAESIAIAKLLFPNG